MYEKESFSNRLKHAWNVFMNKDSIVKIDNNSNWYRPDRVKLTSGNERSIISSIYNRIAIDVSAVGIQHVKLDQNGRYIETINDGLNTILTLEANIDQTSRSFIQDVVLSLFDEGCVAIIPTETTVNPTLTGSYDINSVRTGQVLEWFPNQIRVRAYNENTGQKEDIIVPKKMCCIIENPLYTVMNEPNSTLKRLISKLNLLDAIDSQSGSGKLDLIIQLPYIIKSESRKAQAEARRADIEKQLSNTKYGIAYTDGTEKVTQLNRPAENNLMKQIEYLTSMLFSQLGLTENVFNGTADEKEMLNYYNRTIEPVLSAITDEIKRKFLTKTARTQNHSVIFIRDPFKLVPVSELAEIADKFTRNEILSSNDVRGIIGYKPSNDPKADELRNKNLNASENVPSVTTDNIEKGEKDNEQNI